MEGGREGGVSPLTFLYFSFEFYHRPSLPPSLLPSLLLTHLPIHVGEHALARHVLQSVVELGEAGEEVPAPPLLVGARGLQALPYGGSGSREVVVGNLGEEQMVCHVAVRDVVRQVWGEGGKEGGREERLDVEQ